MEDKDELLKKEYEIQEDRIFKEEDYPNELDEFHFSSRDIKNILRSFKYFNLKYKNEKVERGIEGGPLYVKSFYDFVKKHGIIPTEYEYEKAVFDDNAEFFNKNNFEEGIITGYKSRIYNNYPSIVRDISFCKLASEKLKDCHVIYNMNLDAVEGIDLMLTMNGKHWAFNLYNDTNSGVENRWHKKRKQNCFANVKYIEFPIKLMEDGEKVRDFYLYSQKHVDLMHEIITSKGVEASESQKNIFNFMKKGGNGNLVIEACAGSGKTTTLRKCVDMIPDNKKILVVAFNRDIVSELNEKISGKPNTDIMTLHKLGLSMIRSNIDKEKDFVINDNKYKKHLEDFIDELSTIEIGSLQKNEIVSYEANILKLNNLGRMYLCQTVKELEEVAFKYDLCLMYDETMVTKSLMTWGKENLDEIDYVDMIWLPSALYMKPYGKLYDFIIVDELQDINKAQRSLFMKCFRQGSRFIAAGDPMQCIYGFMGSDEENFQIVKELDNTTMLELPVSYRCSKNIVLFAQKVNKSITYNPDGRYGEIAYDADISEVEDDAMILCRNNAPLVKAYKDLIEMGKKCRILGDEYGNKICEMLSSSKNDSIDASLTTISVFTDMYVELIRSIYRIMNVKGCSYKEACSSHSIASYIDLIQTIGILCAGFEEKKDAIEKIKSIFEDDTKEGIILSTIHKSKGLESNNVYILCKSLLPYPLASSRWEKEQEKNLEYVAYTRARNKLGFLKEENNSPFMLLGKSFHKEIKEIEEKMYALYNFPSDYFEKSYQNEILMKSRTIIEEEMFKNAKDMQIDRSQKKEWYFGNFFRNKSNGRK